MWVINESGDAINLDHVASIGIDEGRRSLILKVYYSNGDSGDLVSYYLPCESSDGFGAQYQAGNEYLDAIMYELLQAMQDGKMVYEMPDEEYEPTRRGVNDER